MAGRTSSYRVDPRGEYVFGVVADQPMRSLRGRQRRLVQPGQLVAWDPSQAHSGMAFEGKEWASRLIVVESADLSALADDRDGMVPSDIAFPEPVISNPALVRSFLEMHASLTTPATRLERDEHLAEWLNAIIELYGASPKRRLTRTPSDDRALGLACDYILDQLDRNVGLEELAAAVGVGKFRLIRLFRERTGLPPHALQIAHRVRKARRLIEAGETISDAAAATGFADQSHLHRHFQRSLGLTPGQYRRRILNGRPVEIT